MCGESYSLPPFDEVQHYTSVAPYQRVDGGFGSGARGSFSSRMAA